MIVAKIQGGLGNQMFQWAFSKSLSKEYNIESFFDVRFYDNQSFNGVERQFQLNKFKSPIRLLGDMKSPNFSNQNFILISDRFEYKKIVLNPKQNYYIDGYWQSEKYFRNFSDEILTNFSPTDDFKKHIGPIYPNLSETVSIHVRRTDYVFSGGYHPVQNIEYYNLALKRIDSDREIIVFSDDLDWCRDNLKYPNINFCDYPSDISQLWIMSMCHSNIIANSSFSWWAAWLNQNPNKKVIAPKNWFGPKTNLSSKDIIPDGWIII